MPRSSSAGGEEEQMFESLSLLKVTPSPGGRGADSQCPAVGSLRTAGEAHGSGPFTQGGATLKGHPLSSQLNWPCDWLSPIQPLALSCSHPFPSLHVLSPGTFSKELPAYRISASVSFLRQAQEVNIIVALYRCGNRGSGSWSNLVKGGMTFNDKTCLTPKPLGAFLFWGILVLTGAGMWSKSDVFAPR